MLVAKDSQEKKIGLFFSEAANIVKLEKNELRMVLQLIESFFKL